MSIFAPALHALWQVALVALVLGAGLPALFALGIRSLSASRTVVATGPDGQVTKASPLGLAGAYVCFAILIAAVLFGFVVIVYGKQLFGV
jgi:hypothetical protein